MIVPEDPQRSFGSDVTKLDLTPKRLLLASDSFIGQFQADLFGESVTNLIQSLWGDLI